MQTVPQWPKQMLVDRVNNLHTLFVFNCRQRSCLRIDGKMADLCAEIDGKKSLTELISAFPEHKFDDQRVLKFMDGLARLGIVEMGKK